MLNPSPRVLILGSGSLARGLATSFEKLGASTWISSKTDLAEGNRMDTVAPDYVVPLVTGFDPSTLIEIENSRQATVAPGAQAFVRTADRLTMRRTASEDLGLPTSAYMTASTREEFEAAVAEMGLPAVVKEAAPSGHGHMLLTDDRDVADCALIERGEVIIERFVDFDVEISLQAVRSIDPSTGELATWFGEPIAYRHEAGQLVESWQPHAIAPAALDNARSMAARITGLLGGQGLYSVDMFVKDDEVYFSTVDPGPSEAGNVTIGAQRFSQFDLHARAVLGLPIDVTLVSPGAYAPVECELDRAGLAAILAVPETTVRLSSGDSLILSTAETTDEARSRVNQAVNVVASSEED